jgi:DNA mismatch endonuclease (patch repair protein)
MQRQRTRDTHPELALRRALHRLGLRYRIERRLDPTSRCRADIVFGPARVAVFVDGCFWHGCAEHTPRAVKANGDYWVNKIRANRDRDAATSERLAAMGWLVMRVWEHEAPADAAARVAAAVRQRRP